MLSLGTLKDLDKPCVMLVRLARAEMLDNLSEVPLPIRFLFICLGPPVPHMDYVEIGRSLSTLMSNQVYRFELLFFDKIETNLHQAFKVLHTNYNFVILVERI